jgi:TPR repeat protein
MAADQGLAWAQFNLGACYDQGEGVKADKKEAVKWYRKAAEQGDAEAQFNLGRAFVNGEGVDKDKMEAVKWLRLAAEQGYEDAEEMLVRLDEEDYLNQDDGNGF